MIYVVNIKLKSWLAITHQLPLVLQLMYNLPHDLSLFFFSLVLLSSCSHHLHLVFSFHPSLFPLSPSRSRFPPIYLS